MSIVEFCKMYINETLHSNKDIMYIDEEEIAVALAFIQMITCFDNDYDVYKQYENEVLKQVQYIYDEYDRIEKSRSSSNKASSILDKLDREKRNVISAIQTELGLLEIYGNVVRIPGRSLIIKIWGMLTFEEIFRVWYYVFEYLHEEMIDDIDRHIKVAIERVKDTELKLMESKVKGLIDRESRNKSDELTKKLRIYILECNLIIGARLSLKFDNRLLHTKYVDKKLIEQFKILADKYIKVTLMDCNNLLYILYCKEVEQLIGNSAIAMSKVDIKKAALSAFNKCTHRQFKDNIMNNDNRLNEAISWFNIETVKENKYKDRRLWRSWGDVSD